MYAYRHTMYAVLRIMYYVWRMGDTPVGKRTPFSMRLTIDYQFRVPVVNIRNLSPSEIAFGNLPGGDGANP
jgi:hypothetical protein